MNPGGYSGIFHFPFRINAQEEFREHNGQGRDFRYQVYPPFLVRRTGSPVTEDVPQELWPSFRWHEAVPQEMREEQAPPPDIRYKIPDGREAIWYDGLRLDLWGADAPNRVSPFVVSALCWLRHMSAQPWISDVDRHYASIKKRAFPIDDSGAAVYEVGGFSEMRIASFQLITDAMWHSAFEHALWYEVPVHSNLFFDAVNAAATDDYPRAIMNLAMALESCRDVNFARLHPWESVQGKITRLQAPFNHTDLLKHLSKDAREAFGRDLSGEQPQHWPHLRNLYLARHYVAHGKGAVFPTDSGLNLVDQTSYQAMQSAAGAALTWMESLSHTKPPS